MQRGSTLDSEAADPGAVASADATTDGGASPDRGWSFAWAWVPSLYFAQGIPYMIVMSLAGDMFVLLGIENDRMARATSLLYLPWVLKPLWSPLVDATGPSRRWTVAMQLLVAGALAAIAAALGLDNFFLPVLAGLWLLAIASATHDIAADVFYLQALPHEDQAWFVGIRSTFYRLAMFFVTAGLLWLAGWLGAWTSDQQAWAWTFAVSAGLFAAFTVYHQLMLPRPETSREADDQHATPLSARLAQTVTSFFAKPGVGLGVAYLLLYRVGEAQLTKLAKPFLFDEVAAGGLALSEQTVATLYGAVGLGLLIAGGLLGGFVASATGLRRVMVPMALSINLPNLCYVYLAYAQPESAWLVGASIGLEQFGYGFGFTGYMLYMMRLAEGPNATTHYALCTGLMALGMMLPGFIAGDVQVGVGYLGFFVWVLVLGLPSLAVTYLVARRLPAGA